MDHQQDFSNNIQDASLGLKSKRDQYNKELRDKLRDEIISEKRKKLIEKNESVLDKVRQQMMGNINSKITLDEKYHPDNILNGISKDNIMKALMVRAEKLLKSFEIGIDDLKNVEVVFLKKIDECRVDDKYPTTEAFEKAKTLCQLSQHCKCLVTSFSGLPICLTSNNLTLISTAILASGEDSRKLEWLLPQLESHGIDIKNMKSASEGIKQAMKGVNDFQLEQEPE